MSMKRNGFTLIEVLVASLLLSMLVVILTMVFNQSSIAWRTGRANVSEMDKMRRLISVAQRQADNMLPGIDRTSKSTMGVVVSAWKDSSWSGDGQNGLRKRGVERLAATKLSGGDFERPEDAWQEPSLGLNNLTMGDLKTYVVGVKSWGPDGQEDTEDDISSWPVIEVE